MWIFHRLRSNEFPIPFFELSMDAQSFSSTALQVNVFNITSNSIQIDNITLLSEERVYITYLKTSNRIVIILFTFIEKIKNYKLLNYSFEKHCCVFDVLQIALHAHEKIAPCSLSLSVHNNVSERKGKVIIIIKYPHTHKIISDQIVKNTIKILMMI